MKGRPGEDGECVRWHVWHVGVASLDEGPSRRGRRAWDYDPTESDTIMIASMKGRPGEDGEWILLKSGVSVTMTTPR